MAVSWDKRNKKWKARLCYHGTVVWLGNYADRRGAEMANEEFWAEETAQTNKLGWWLAFRFGGRPSDYDGACVAALREYAAEAEGQTVFRYVTEWVARGGARVDGEYARRVVRKMMSWREGYLYAYCFMGEKWLMARERRGKPMYCEFQKDIEMLTRENEMYIIESKGVCG